MKLNYTILVRRIATLVVISGFLAIVSLGCRTAHGFGEDMQNAGEGIQQGTK
jgi:predicted small secreted protein